MDNWIYYTSEKYAPIIKIDDIHLNTATNEPFIQIRDNKIYINNKEVIAIYQNVNGAIKKLNVYIGDQNNQPQLILTE